MTEQVTITIVYTPHFSSEKIDENGLSSLFNKAIEAKLISLPDRHPFSQKYSSYIVSFHREDGQCFGMPDSRITMIIQKKE